MGPDSAMGSRHVLMLDGVALSQKHHVRSMGILLHLACGQKCVLPASTLPEKEGLGHGYTCLSYIKTVHEEFPLEMTWKLQLVQNMAALILVGAGR